MKKLNQHGIAHIVLILLAVVVLAGAGFAGWRVYESKKDKKPSTSQTSQKTTEKDNTEKVKTDSTQELSETEILDLSDSPISLKKPEDIDKLPAKTPKSFIEMLKADLANFKCEDDEGGMYILQISKKYIHSSEGCFGAGVSKYWYLKNNKWEVLGLQNAPDCSKLKATGIPSEFIKVCFVEGSSELIPNPNGSIKD